MSLSSRYFAWLMSKIAARYNRRFGDRKRELFGALAGTVLEIGPGTGPNLRYLPPEVDYLGLEPNLAMQARLRRNAEALGRTVRVERGFANDTGLGDASVDAVISTLVLCSVPDLELTLAELHRVLKPGGAFVFLEHVIARPHRPLLRRAQRISSRPWRYFNANCHPDRDIASAIASCGFANVEVEHVDGPLPIPLIKPHIIGTATKPGPVTSPAGR